MMEGQNFNSELTAVQIILGLFARNFLESPLPPASACRHSDTSYLKDSTFHKKKRWKSFKF
jgi:hypothetical protein